MLTCQITGYNLHVFLVNIVHCIHILEQKDNCSPVAKLNIVVSLIQQIIVIL